jgi:isopropylmalate/homocitrate/citramalate synthase
MKTQVFVDSLMAALDETFDVHHGIFLDKGTSLFETIDALTAAEASRSIGRCATVAAHVAHVTFYLSVLERYMASGAVETIDWRAIWSTVGVVTPEEWQRLKNALRETAARVRSAIHNRSSWDDEAAVGAALAIVVHTAYHLGAIRQAVCAGR